jgi:2-polyprenyl-3-methyl-5-hydroxy-6-metoxy-1,4-benzoquinol methylase
MEQYIKEYNKHNFEAVQVSYKQKKVLEQLRLYPHKNILDIGCGPSPLFIYTDDFDTMTVVDPETEFIENAKRLSQGNTRIKCVCGFFEETVAELSSTSDFIVVSGLLHEIEQPDVFMEALKSVCTVDTVVYINVPNAYSLHRILAREMGLIKEVTDKSDAQIRLQQQSTFSMETLSELIESHHFTIIDKGAFFIKPFTHRQMHAMLAARIIDFNVLDGLYKLSEYLPEYGSEIYVNCKIQTR